MSYFRALASSQNHAIDISTALGAPARNQRTIGGDTGSWRGHRQLAGTQAVGGDTGS